MDNIIQTRKLCKHYGDINKTKVLFDIDLDIKQGELTAIIGESGSGKSTLLNIISTLDSQTSGDVLIENKNILNMSEEELSKFRNTKIGFIFQFHFLINEFSVIENVMMPYYILSNKVNKDKIKDAEELLTLVGLINYKDKKASELSGGQMQRVAIARALMNKPKIVFADEPTGNLDSVTTDEIFNLIKTINLTLKTTFIVITHDKKIAERANRIIELENGKIKMDIRK